MPPPKQPYTNSTYSPYTNLMPDLRGIDFNSLSDTRRKVINLWLPQVVPSTEGGDDKKFDKLMTHQKCIDARAQNPNFTTCGSLPGWLFTQLGIPKLANYGLKGVKDAAIDLGCWVDNPIVFDPYYESSPDDIYDDDAGPRP